MFWIPILAGVAVWRWHVNKTATEKMTPERMAHYEYAMTFIRDPTKLQSLADAFDKVGLSEQAKNLRARANLPSLPKNIQAARESALKQGLSSKNPAAILTLADAFEKEGALASATMLRQYADGLKVDSSIPPKVPPVQEPAHSAETAEDGTKL